MFAAGLYAVARPPEGTGRAGSDTVGWTLVGGAIGFLVALVTAVAALAARARRPPLTAQRRDDEPVGREPQLSERR
jgi:hypothetical protein